MSTTIKKATLQIRNAAMRDVPGICQLDAAVYPDITPWKPELIESQIRNYSEGQFVAVYDGVIVGYCATLRISGELALAPHTWSGITGDGYATTNDPKGDYLYGFEMCVAETHRHHHIARRFYRERKKLCSYLHLKGIIVGCRLPHFAENIKKIKTPENYIEQACVGEIHDELINFELHNGFKSIGVLRNYLPEDKKSLGYAAHFIWQNPEFPIETTQVQTDRRRRIRTLAGFARVATVQYGQRRITSFEEFEQQVEYFVNSVAEYRADFVSFPEFFTMQLLSLYKNLSPTEALLELTKYTEKFKSFMSQLAIDYDVNIVGGTHPTKDVTGIQNIAYVFLRDGSIHAQAKIHPTPSEKHIWRMQGSNELNAIQTDCGPIGVLICYDCEFPELARHLVEQGIYILFVPFCTDERRGYLRVRYCAQARAIENQCYVVMSGNVGNLPGVTNMNVQYAQSCILTPSDFPFSRDGIAQDTTPNIETIAIADLNIKAVIESRNAGTVLNLKDRRHDLYSVDWKK